MEEVKDMVVVESNDNMNNSLVIPHRQELEDRLNLSKNYLSLRVSQFSGNYPEVVKQGMQEVVDIVNANKTLPELYSEILEEVSVGQSTVQSQAVQMEQHFTPHRKLRQIMLELDGKLGALDTAKNGCKKAVVKLATLKDEIEALQEIYNKVNDGVLTATVLMEVATFVPNCVPESLINSAILLGDKGIESDIIKNRIITKLKSILGDKLVKFDETERGLKSHQHMVKDAAFAAYHLREQVAKHTKEAQDTGWSFEEAELYYYVMYFTAEGEKQIRTMGRIDTGTFGVVASMPKGLRTKIMSNWDFILTKHADVLNKYGKDSFKGYYLQEYKEQMEPVWDEENRTFEGDSLKDFIGVDVPLILAKKD